ncbi:MAG: hypothetical protein P1U57_06320 [Oleibacter sp.]|nr:hypothetical protein [Thalassolituus sp.]
MGLPTVTTYLLRFFRHPNVALMVKTFNKAKQHQPLRGLDSLAAALFVHGFAIIAQKSQLQVCRCWQRYAF